MKRTLRTLRRIASRLGRAPVISGHCCTASPALASALLPAAPTRLTRMTILRTLIEAFDLLIAASSCGLDHQSAAHERHMAARFTRAPTLNLQTSQGKPHLTWMTSETDDQSMVERKECGSTATWTVLRVAARSRTRTAHFCDAGASIERRYLYRVVAVRGGERVVSNETSWPC